MILLDQKTEFCGSAIIADAYVDCSLFIIATINNDAYFVMNF